MPKPGLNVLKRISQIQHYRRTAMTKIVKSELRHIMLPQNSWNMGRKITWFDQFSNFVHIDIVQILLTVAATTQFPVLFLLCFHPKQNLLKGCNQRECPKTGFRFGTVRFDQLCFTIYRGFCNSMANSDGFSLKINSIPS